MTNPENNPIGFLQEICQKHCYRFPQYEDIESSGPDHCREFTVLCKFEGLEALGRSRQKKQAKSEAAKAMVALLKQNDNFDKLKLTNGLSIDINHENEVGALLENNISFSESKNPISAINEFCQKTSLPPPQFVETSAAGVFICECRLKDKKTYGHGSNKKSAKTEAAHKMCIEFNMKCSGIGYLLKESQMEDNFELGKNPVSELQELSAQNPFWKTPEYTEMPSVMNLFVVKCTVNSISCEGRGTSKKSAKTVAAKQVLIKLLAQSENSDGQIPAVSALPKVLTSGGISAVSPPGVQVRSELQDFSVDSSEEEEDEEEKNKQEDLSTAVDVNLSLNLKALSIEAEQEVKGVSDNKSGEINEAQEEPVKSSGESSILS